MSIAVVAILVFGKHPELLTLLRCLAPITLPEDDGNCSPHATPEQSAPIWQEVVHDGAPKLGNLLDEDHMAFLGHLEYLFLQLLGEGPLLFFAYMGLVFRSTNVVSHNQATVLIG